ncbi:MAG: alpha-glucosidase [Promethearchaeota archaeon]
MTAPPSDTPVWWKTTTIYQIYPRSFHDSNADGIGDLPGIIEKLDYLQQLGIETIWFSPFYSSPQADFGYDISDYQGIAPEYGTMEDCNRLIREIHDRGMKIVFDMVMNHTSDQHPWFLESRANRENPKRDWYIWRDGKKPNGGAPPNNWQSRITGSGWHYDPTTDQWYWAQFLPFQPDLNYRNPEVKQTMFDVVRFWLRKGVDGFRLDIFDAVFEDPSFANNPRSWRLMPSAESTDALFQSPKMTVNHPDNLLFARELRAAIDEFSDPPRFIIGENAGSLEMLRKYCGEQQNDGLNLVFLFGTMGLPFHARGIRKIIASFEKYFPDPFLPTWVFSNHDIIRQISRRGNNIQKAKLLAALQLTVRGVPVIYYGEEIGQHQHAIPLSESQDAVSHHFGKFPRFIQKLLLKLADEATHRDNCRTPMQWSSQSPHAGFCPPTVDPWLPVTPSYPTINVSTVKKEADSIYYCYHRFLALRKQLAQLHAGQIHLIEARVLPKNVLGYIRYLPSDAPETNGLSPAIRDDGIYVFLNFSPKPLIFACPQGLVSPSMMTSTVLKSLALFTPDHISLAPYEGVVMQNGR